MVRIILNAILVIFYTVSCGSFKEIDDTDISSLLLSTFYVNVSVVREFFKIILWLSKARVEIS